MDQGHIKPEVLTFEGFWKGFLEGQSKNGIPYTREMAQGMWDELQKSQKCMRCQTKKDVGLAVFLPHDSEKYGAEGGKTRMIFYRICAVCLQNHTEEIEDELEKDANAKH